MILLPADTDWTDHETLKFVLAHEFAHIRRWDGLWKPVMAAAVCVHWFNPLVWVMFRLFSRDVELACDESVVRHLGEDCRSSYVLALLSVAERRLAWAELHTGFGFGPAQERVRAILKGKKTRLWQRFLAVVLVALVTVCLGTSPLAAPKEENEPATQTSIVLISRKGNLWLSFEVPSGSGDDVQPRRVSIRQNDGVNSGDPVCIHIFSKGSEG